MPDGYDGEMVLRCAMDGGNTNSKQHLRDSGVCEKKVYSNVTTAKRRAF